MPGNPAPAGMRCGSREAAIVTDIAGTMRTLRASISTSTSTSTGCRCISSIIPPDCAYASDEAGAYRHRTRPQEIEQARSRAVYMVDGTTTDAVDPAPTSAGLLIARPPVKIYRITVVRK